MTWPRNWITGFAASARPTSIVASADDASGSSANRRFATVSIRVALGRPSPGSAHATAIVSAHRSLAAASASSFGAMPSTSPAVGLFPGTSGRGCPGSIRKDARSTPKKRSRYSRPESSPGREALVAMILNWSEEGSSPSRDARFRTTIPTSAPVLPRYRCSSSTTRVKTWSDDRWSHRRVDSKIGSSTSRISITLSIE